MKKYFKIISSFFLLTIVAITTQAQTKKTITLDGVDPEVSKSMYLYDELSPNKSGDVYFHMEIKNSSMSKWVIKSNFRGPAKFNRESKRFEINLTSIVFETGGASWDKPVKIRVSVPTVMGNSLWTEVERNPNEIEKPIILNNYSGVKYYKRAIPKKTLKVKLVGPSAMPKELFEKLDRKGGEKFDTENQGWFLYLKNEGSQEWTAGAHEQNRLSPSHPDSGVWVFAFKLNDGEDGNNFDMYKPMIIEVAIPTNFGNVIWLEGKYTAEMMPDWNANPLKFQYLSGRLGFPDEPLHTQKNPAGAGLVPFSGGSAATSSVVTTTTGAATPKSKPSAKNTLNLKQHQGSVQIANLPDTITLGNLISTLEDNTEISVGNQKIALKGNMPINYNMSKGYIIMAHANGDQTIETKYGALKIKDGSPIQFSPYKVTGVVLAEDVNMNLPTGEIRAKANTKANEYDVLFEDNGSFEQATLANGITLNIADKTMNVPAGSEVTLQKEKIIAMKYGGDEQIDIAGMSLTIKADSDKPSVKCDSKTGNISELFLVSAPDIATSEGPIKVKNDSYMNFEKEGEGYIVSRFVIGETKELNVYRKNGKSKPKTAKTGRRITIVDGQVRKVSM